MDIDILDTLSMPELGMKLQQARKRSGLTQAEAAEKVQIARTTLIAIEKGERRIKASELIQLACAYGRQVNEFVRPRPLIDPFVVRFRRFLPAVDEDAALIEEYINRFEALCQDYLELEQIAESPLTYKYPSEYKIGALPLALTAEIIAQEERNRLGLGDGPIPLLRELLEQDVGLRIFYLEMKPSDNFSAMFTYDPKLGGCIAVNTLHSEERKRLALAHEYAHFLVQREKAELLTPDKYQRKPENERLAGFFALYFLMPTAGLTRRYNDIVQTQGKFTVADLSTLAHYYGVSVDTLARRLEEQKLLPAGTWDRLGESGTRAQNDQQIVESPPISDPADKLPRRYQYLVVDLYDQGKITEGESARFLRVDRLKVRQIAAARRAEASYIMENAPLDLTHLVAK